VTLPARDSLLAVERRLSRLAATLSAPRALAVLQPPTAWTACLADPLARFDALLDEAARDERGGATEPAAPHRAAAVPPAPVRPVAPPLSAAPAAPPPARAPVSSPAAVAPTIAPVAASSAAALDAPAPPRRHLLGRPRVTAALADRRGAASPAAVRPPPPGGRALPLSATTTLGASLPSAPADSRVTATTTATPPSPPPTDAPAGTTPAASTPAPGRATSAPGRATPAAAVPTQPVRNADASRLLLVDGAAAAASVLQAQVLPLAQPRSAARATEPGRRTEGDPAPVFAPTPPATPTPPLTSAAVDLLLDALSERVRLDVERTYGSTEV
jgi:hypothetical protein